MDTDAGLFQPGPEPDLEAAFADHENQHFLHALDALAAEEKDKTMPLTISWKEEG